MIKTKISMACVYIDHEYKKDTEALTATINEVCIG